MERQVRSKSSLSQRFSKSILTKLCATSLTDTGNSTLSVIAIFVMQSNVMKKWFNCKYLVTVILIYGMSSFHLLHDCLHFLILIFYHHWGRSWASSWWNGHNKCLFPLWGTLFSTPSPKKPKNKFRSSFWKKRIVLRTWKRKHHKKI